MGIHRSFQHGLAVHIPAFPDTLAANNSDVGRGCPLLAVERIEVGYERRSAAVLESVSLRCYPRQFVAVVGKSGTGKSTLLKAIAGLLPVRAGRILFEGVPVVGPSRNRGLVLQRYPVFPWLRVRENIVFGARQAAREGDTVDPALVDTLIARSGLTPHVAKYPAELSGGMQQRVALARAIAARPKLLLLDEPFGALDVLTRGHMIDLIRELADSSVPGVLLVTHDVRDAVLLADRVVVLAGEPATAVQEYAPPNPRTWKDATVLQPEQEEVARSIIRTIRGEGRVNN